jgi:hypothetical protein
MHQVDLCWFLFMTGEEGMRQGQMPRGAAAPATVTGKVPDATAHARGKARDRWGNPESASRETCQHM